MTSFRFLLRAITVGLVIAGTTAAKGAVEKTDNRDRLLQERTYLGKTFTYWLKMLQDRDEETITLAFDAIRSLGPDGWIAAPDLTRLIAAPFSPIDIGKDSRKSIATKLHDIALRAEAIDTLARMGESGSPSGIVLVRWALAERVIPGQAPNREDDELLMELVIMDAEQRMRVAGAIAQFGPAASPMIAGLLTSPDAVRRKLGVAILSQGALPIAAELLRSRGCDDQSLGLLILQDMELVFSKPLLDELKQRLACSRVANAVSGQRVINEPRNAPRLKGNSEGGKPTAIALMSN